MAARLLRDVVSKMKPLIVILGATGTGKSKLAIELACQFNGEIISADSMQVYQGLDIITNKVTHEERLMCVHHMIDFISPLKSNYTITDFKNASLQIMEDIWQREKLPIVVGGTNYYIESLLWDFVLDKLDSQISSSDEDEDEGGDDSRKRAADDEGRSTQTSAAETGAGCITNSEFQLPFFTCDLKVPTRELHSKLKLVDPESALIIHPNDRRKILRALQVFQQTGMTQSQHLEKQRKADLAVSGGLRHTNTRMIWIQCEQRILDERLNKRVDDMISAGLLPEMLNFHQLYNQQEEANGRRRDYTLGIFQTIGFKEFHKYLMLTDEERSSDYGRQLFSEGVEDMKRATRRYARRQLKWIVGRFMRRKMVDVPPLYVVDATDMSEWDRKVLTPASEVVSSLLQGRSPSVESVKCEQGEDNRVFRECLDCNVTAISRSNWEAHVKGRRHKKRVASRRKAEHDLLSTLTVYKRKLLDEQVTGLRADSSSRRSEDSAVLDSNADTSSVLNTSADVSNNG